MIFILVGSCFLIPYEIAFPDNKDGSRDMVKMVLDKIFDVFFFIDVILTFYSAVLIEDYSLIDDRKGIAMNYLKGWFTLDILSCIPYGEIGAALLSEKQMVHLQMFKLIKLLRVLKLVKEQGKLFMYMDHYLGISNSGIQRLCFFMCVFIIMAHSTCCIWII